MVGALATLLTGYINVFGIIVILLLGVVGFVAVLIARRSRLLSSNVWAITHARESSEWSKSLDDGKDDYIAKINELSAEVNRLKGLVDREVQERNALTWSVNNIQDGMLPRLRLEEYRYHKTLKPSLYKEGLIEWFMDKSGRNINLDNPKTLSEKVQWLKLNDSTPLKTELADKVKVKPWLARTLGKEVTPATLGVFERYEDIDFDALPDKFVMKCNHGADYNLVVTDKSELDHKKLTIQFNKWLNTNHAFVNGFELHYNDVPRRILVEEYLELDKEFEDIKIFCFNGEPRIILVRTEVDGKFSKAYYNVNWELLPFKEIGVAQSPYVPPPPALPEMLDISRQVSADFALVRVDFMLSHGRPILGELTFTPMTGIFYFEDETLDARLGSLLTLPTVAPVLEAVIPQ